MSTYYTTVKCQGFIAVGAAGAAYNHLNNFPNTLRACAHTHQMFISVARKLKYVTRFCQKQHTLKDKNNYFQPYITNSQSYILQSRLMHSEPTTKSVQQFLRLHKII